MAGETEADGDGEAEADGDAEDAPPFAAASTASLSFCGVIGLAWSAKMSLPFSSTAGVPRNFPARKASKDLATQLLCVPSSTQRRNSGVSSPGTLAASSSSLAFLL